MDTHLFVRELHLNIGEAASRALWEEVPDEPIAGVCAIMPRVSVHHTIGQCARDVERFMGMARLQTRAAVAKHAQKHQIRSKKPEAQQFPCSDSR